MTNERAILIANRIKERRTRLNASHITLARALEIQYNIKISPESLKNYEISDENHSKFGAVKGMKIEYLDALASMFGVSCDWLLGISKTPTPDAIEQSISGRLGLSDKAINNLSNGVFNRNKYDIVNKFIGHECFLLLMGDIKDYVRVKKYNDTHDPFDPVTNPWNSKNPINNYINHMRNGWTLENSLLDKEIQKTMAIASKEIQTAIDLLKDNVVRTDELVSLKENTVKKLMMLMIEDIERDCPNNDL